MGEIYIRRGNNTWGEILCNVDGKWVREDHTHRGEILVYIDGKFIRDGDDKWGEILARLEGKCVREGEEPFSDFICNIDDDWIRKGRSSWNEIIFNIEGEASDIEKAALAVAALKMSGELGVTEADEDVGDKQQVERLEKPKRSSGGASVRNCDSGEMISSSGGSTSGGGGSGSGDSSGNILGCLIVFFFSAVVAVVGVINHYLIDDSPPPKTEAVSSFVTPPVTKFPTPPFQPVETPFPVITPIPVVRQVQSIATARVYDGTGKVYKIPELKALAGKRLTNSWVYGKFSFWRQDGNILRCFTAAVVLGGGQQGSTRVDIEFQGGINIDPSVIAASQSGLLTIVPIERSSPLELLSVDWVENRLLVRARTHRGYITGPSNWRPSQ